METIAHLFRFSLQVLTLDKRPSEYPSQIKYTYLALVIAFLSEMALGLISGYNFYVLATTIVSLAWIDVFLVLLNMEYRLKQSIGTFLGVSVIGNTIACILFIFLESESVIPLMISLLFKIIVMHRLHRFAFRLKSSTLTISTISYAIFITATFFGLASLHSAHYFNK
jgi:hypothetical protein